jgi:hypothetical protein
MSDTTAGAGLRSVASQEKVQRCGGVGEQSGKWKMESEKAR